MSSFVETLKIEEDWVQANGHADAMLEALDMSSSIDLSAGVRTQDLDLGGRHGSLARLGKRMLEVRYERHIGADGVERGPDNTAWNGETLGSLDVIQDTDDAMAVQAMVNVAIDRLKEEGVLDASTPDAGPLNGFITSEQSREAIILLQNTFEIKPADGHAGKAVIEELVRRHEAWAEAGAPAPSPPRAPVSTTSVSEFQEVYDDLSSYAGDPALGGNSKAVELITELAATQGIEIDPSTGVDERSIMLLEAKLNQRVDGHLDNSLLDSLVQKASDAGFDPTVSRALSEVTAEAAPPTGEYSSASALLAFLENDRLPSASDSAVKQEGFYAVLQVFSEENLDWDRNTTLTQAEQLEAMVLDVFNLAPSDLPSHPELQGFFTSRVRNYVSSNRDFRDAFGLS